MTVDRRQFRRYEVTGIVGAVDGRIRYLVRVIGLGGMLVESNRDLAPGERGTFAVDLREHGKFESPGRILYLGPSSPGAWRLGVAFDGTSAANRRLLEGFLVGREGGLDGNANQDRDG